MDLGASWAASAIKDLGAQAAVQREEAEELVFRPLAAEARRMAVLAEEYQAKAMAAARAHYAIAYEKQPLLTTVASVSALVLAFPATRRFVFRSESERVCGCATRRSLADPNPLPSRSACRSDSLRPPARIQGALRLRSQEGLYKSALRRKTVLEQAVDLHMKETNKLLDRTKAAKAEFVNAQKKLKDARNQMDSLQTRLHRTDRTVWGLLDDLSAVKTKDAVALRSEVQVVRDVGKSTSTKVKRAIKDIAVTAGI